MSSWLSQARSALLALALVAASAPAHGADETPSSNNHAANNHAANNHATDDDGWPAPLPSIIAVVPGFVVHGAGHYAAGRTRTGNRLLAMEGIGLGLAAMGGVSLALTGANRDLSAPAATMAIAGAALLQASHITDFVNATWGPDGPGDPILTPPVALTELGYRFVEDPQFSYNNFLVQSIDLRWSHFRLHPSAWFALDDNNSRLRLLSAFRFFGPMPGASEPARDGSFVDLELAGTHHGYRSDGFRVVTGEAALAGRLDMKRIDDNLGGSFGEFATGIALAFPAYDYGSFEVGREVDALLLGRFAYGIYIGHAPAPQGEVKLFYDHRHDGYAAGLVAGGVGVPGSFGLSSQLFLSSDIGLATEVAVGSAFVGGVSILYRGTPAGMTSP